MMKGVEVLEKKKREKEVKKKGKKENGQEPWQPNYRDSINILAVNRRRM